MKRVCRIVAPLIAGALMLGACGGGDDGAPDSSAMGGFPLTIDSCGRQVTFEEPPERVLTVASVAAPLLAAAGAADKIIARSFETATFPGEYAPQLDSVPLLSTTDELGREVIIAKDPDLVVTFGGAETSSPAELEPAGINVLVPRGYCTDTARGDFEEIFADIELYGRLLGTDAAADREVSELRERVAAVRQDAQSSTSNRSAAALILSRDDTATISAYGDRSTVDQQMDILGLRNVFGDVDQRVFEPNIEEIVNRNPDVIILLLQGTQTAQDAHDTLRTRPELQSVTAIRNDDIVVLPFGFVGPSPVAVEGLEVLARELDAVS